MRVKIDKVGWLKGYKVVEQVGAGAAKRRFYSWLYGETVPGAVEYGVRRLAAPANGFGPLAVFKGTPEGLSAALDFVSAPADRIFECFYLPSTRTALSRLDENGKKEATRPLNKLPDQTVLAEAVILTKRVRPEKGDTQ